MIEKIYSKIIELSKTQYAIHLLLLVAFLESFIFPIPPDIFLIFLILAYKKESGYIIWGHFAINMAFSLALFCTIFSVAGGVLGYFIGSLFFDSLGQDILNYYNLNEKFLTFSQNYNKHGNLIVAAGGFTPIPYKLITIFSGFVKMNFLEFIITSFISRGARFFLIATLLYFYGKKIETFLIKRFGLLTLLLFLLLISLYIFSKYFNFY